MFFMMETGWRCLLNHARIAPAYAFARILSSKLPTLSLQNGIQTARQTIAKLSLLLSCYSGRRGLLSLGPRMHYMRTTLGGRHN